MSSGTWQMRGTVGGGAPPPSAQKQGKSGITPFAGTDVVYVTSNYSVAPGPAWIELTNPVAYSPTGVVTIALPVRGAGEYMSHLSLPIGCVIVGPGALAAMAQLQQPLAAKPGSDPKQAEQQKQQEQKELEQKVEAAQKEQEQHKKKQQEEQKQDAEKQKKDYEAELAAKSMLVAPLSANQQQADLARLWLPNYEVTGRANQVGPAESGMSAQGFPGIPQPLGILSVLPPTLGVNGATINTFVSPPELNITFVGSGAVPAGSRWLVFTITGV